MAPLAGSSTKIQTIQEIFSLPLFAGSIHRSSLEQILLLIGHCKTLQQIKAFHARTISNGLLPCYPSTILNKILLSLTLIYSPSCLHYAVAVFHQIPEPSTFSYNNIVRAHTLLSSPLSALHMFAKMRNSGIPPDTHTYPFALKACAHLRLYPLARVLHSEALKFGFNDDMFVRNSLIHVYSESNAMAEACRLSVESKTGDVVSSNVLIDGFLKLGNISRARSIFDEMPIKDAVSWGTLMAGYARLNRCEEAIQLFDEMIACGLQPDNVALVSVLSACAQLGAVQRGEDVHNYIRSRGILLDEFLTTGLVDMYAKCGFIRAALEVFQSCSKKNLFTWNAVILGLAMHGHGEQSLEHFGRMQRVGIRPDGITFLGVLVGCCHAGLVDEARRLFNEMEVVYGVRPELKHYGCMADLLGRAGLIDEATEMIREMPMKGDVYVWGGLLAGCRIHGRVEEAEIAARHVMELDPEDGGVYSIMTDIYANANRWADVVKMRKLMRERGLKKNAGLSLVEIDGVNHEFVSEKNPHRPIAEIY